MRPPARGALLVALALVATSCGDDAPARDGPAGEVLVSAAASLGPAFGQVERAVEAAHPGIDVVLNLAGSATLREQVLAGAPVDVLATADAASMAPVLAAGLAAGPVRPFATNALVVAVPAGNPAGIAGIEAFSDEALLLGTCVRGVPCGDLAHEALRAAGVAPALDTEELDVAALVARVAAGELDAGLAYVTDVVGAGGRVEGIDLPATAAVSTTYPLAVLADAPNPAAAEAFAAFVLSEDGRAILRAARFGPP